MICIVLATTALFCAEPTYALDNGVIRIEVEPRLFAVRFAGFKDKQNFVSPIEVEASAADGKDWADAGGLQTDLVPYSGKDAATRRGPAEVIEYRGDYVAMLGPPSESSGMRLKKEIQLDGDAPRARFRVTAQRVGAEPVKLALRNTVRLGEKNTVRLERTDGEIRVLAGTDAIAPAVVKSRRYWLIPIPPTREMRGVILGSVAPRMIVANDAGTWTRTLIDPPADMAQVPNESTFLCVLDSTSASYGAALQGKLIEIKTGEFITLEEEWIFDKRGK
jgi:hypothetical protein